MIFAEPFDIEAIEDALVDDRFLHVAFMTMGVEESWRAGVEQVARLLTAYEAAEHDDRAVYRIILVLVQRAHTFGPAYVAEISEKLCLMAGSIRPFDPNAAKPVSAPQPDGGKAGGQ